MDLSVKNIIICYSPFDPCNPSTDCSAKNSPTLSMINLTRTPNPNPYFQISLASNAASATKTSNPNALKKPPRIQPPTQSTLTLKSSPCPVLAWTMYKWFPITWSHVSHTCLLSSLKNTLWPITCQSKSKLKPTCEAF